MNHPALQLVKDWLSVAGNVAAIVSAIISFQLYRGTVEPAVDWVLPPGWAWIHWLLGPGLAVVMFLWIQKVVRNRDASVGGALDRVASLEKRVGVLEIINAFQDRVVKAVIEHSRDGLDRDELVQSLTRLRKEAAQNAPSAVKERLGAIVKHLHAELAKDDASRDEDLRGAA